MRPRRLPDEALRQVLRERAGISAAELAARLGVSQPTVSRGLAALGADLVRLGRARNVRYALARPIAGYGSQWPLHRIDAQGRPARLGQLRALHGGVWQFEPDQPMPAWLAGEFASGLFPDLPWFLDDLRPQGYLGRSFVLAHARDLDAPDDLSLWHSDHVVAALLRHGDNLPGDLVLGDAALTRALQAGVQPTDALDIERDTTQRSHAYPQLALAALSGRPVGSSAGGEQPKFTVLLREAPERYRAAVVKFSEPVTSSASAERWADLLLCEHLAGQVLNHLNIAPAAVTEVIEADGRRFLESSRFDRTGTLGRRGYVTLRALDAAFFGTGRAPWAQMADRLLAEHWIVAEDAETLRTLGLFGELIGNTDMHFGNLAFVLTDAAPFALSPVYDMLPMRYAPGPGGAIVAREFDPPMPLPHLRAAWLRAADAARQYWSVVAADAGISTGFRQIAADNGARVQGLLQRFG